jgi:ATP-dependent helicase/nuclease subunit B
MIYMALRFILGRAGCGKTTVCLKEIAAKQHTSQNDIIYIVPEQFSLQAEKSILRFSKEKVMLKAQVLSFNRLAYNVFKKTGVSKTEVLDDMGKSMAIRKIVNTRRDDFEYFVSGCDKKGFTEQLKLTITELFKYGISTDALKKSMDDNSDNTMLKCKLHDTAIIYEDYRKFLESGYISGDDTLDMLYEKMDDAYFLKNCEVWIDGFSGFTPQELKIINKLIKICVNVSITLTMGQAAYENDSLSMSSLFFEPRETLKNIRRMTIDSGCKILPPVILEKPFRFRAKSLAYLEEGLTTFSPKAHDNCAAVHLYSASSRFDEATNVACRILDTVKNKGICFKDIAVLTGDISSYANTIKAIFTECKIPFFIDIKREMLSMPFVVFITSLLDTAIKNMSYESVFTLLKTGLFPMERDDIEILENYVLAHGIRGSMWQKEWTYKDVNNNPDFYEKINFLRSEVVNKLNFPAKRKYTVENICSQIYKTITDLKINEKTEEICSLFEENKNFAKSYETRQCYNTVMDILDTMCVISGDEKVTYEEFESLFESAVISGKIGIIPPGIDNVLIGDIDRTRLPETKLLFIIGANEGIFPPAVEDAGLFSETERELMKNSGMSLAPDSKRKAFQSRFNVYSALTKAENGLYISWVQSDLQGKAIQPSPVVNTIIKIFPKIKVIKSDDKETESLILSSPQCAFHRLGEAVSNSSQSPFYKSVLEYFYNDENWHDKTCALMKGADEKNMPALSKSITDKLYKENMYSSISRLEKFAACPYMYFMAYTMEARERPLFELGTPDLGRIFHAVIEDFSSSVNEKGMSWNDLDDDKTTALANESIKRQIPLIENDVLFSSSAMKYLVKRIEQISLRAITTLTQHVKKGTFRPYAFELGFGKGNLAPIVLDIGNGRKMYLTGQIDRVDIMEKDGSVYVKIVDYKSGNKDFSLQDIYYGLQLQLMIYIDAVINSGFIKNENILPGGVFYFRIKDPVIKGISTLDMTDDDIKNLITRELKMSGLVLNEDDVIKGMDKDFDKSSDIIPVHLKKDGTQAANSYAADTKTFRHIMDYCLKKASVLGKNIADGYIKPSPVSTSQFLPCGYCPYSSVCGFDAAENHITLKKLNKDEALYKINNEVKE